MKPDLLPATVLAAVVLLALVPADAAAQRRGGSAHAGGGRSVVVVRPIGLRAGAPVGGGSATLAKTHGDLFGTIPAGGHSFRGRGGSPISTATLVRVNDDFFIAEPQVNALLSLTKWMRLDAGVGYRLIGGADLLGGDLRGISGSIAVQIGGR